MLAQSLRRGEREESLRLHRHVLSRSLAWLIKGIWFLCQALLVAWATLAIYYSNLPWAGLRLALAAVFSAEISAADAVALCTPAVAAGTYPYRMPASEGGVHFETQTYRWVFVNVAPSAGATARSRLAAECMKVA